MLNQVADGVWVRQSEWEEPADARLSQEWLAGPHQSNLKQAREG